MTLPLAHAERSSVVDADFTVVCGPRAPWFRRIDWGRVVIAILVGGVLRLTGMAVYRGLHLLGL